jgi:hypothetical protein
MKEFKFGFRPYESVVRKKPKKTSSTQHGFETKTIKKRPNIPVQKTYETVYKKPTKQVSRSGVGYAKGTSGRINSSGRFIANKEKKVEYKYLGDGKYEKVEHRRKTFLAGKSGASKFGKRKSGGYNIEKFWGI